MRHLLVAVSGVVVAAVLGAAQPPVAPPPRAVGVTADPWFVDDTAFFDGFMEKLTRLAKRGKCLAHDKLVAKMKPRPVGITPAKAGDRGLSPEEVYRLARPSVFVVGSVYKDKDTGEWTDGLYATAWAATADGVLVTNWHVFEDLQESEVFGATDHKGTVYPLVDFLGGDKGADVAVVRIGAKGMTPLPVAERPAAVGSWVGLVSHPGDNFYLFTQGHVTRYSTNKADDGTVERWMGVTAEYAGGSSGGPVLNDRGAVVGMAALTLTIDSPNEPARRLPGVRRKAVTPPKEKPGEKPPPGVPPPKLGGKDDPKDKKPDPPAPQPAPAPASVQMIIKMAVPGPVIRDVLTK